MSTTPHFDAWRERTAAALASYGRKAELARHLAGCYGRDSQSWQNDIARYLSGRQTPTAEPLLAIDAWLTAQSLRKDRGGGRVKARPVPRVSRKVELRRGKAESKKIDGRA